MVGYIFCKFFATPPTAAPSPGLWLKAYRSPARLKRATLYCQIGAGMWARATTNGRRMRRRAAPPALPLQPIYHSHVGDMAARRWLAARLNGAYVNDARIRRALLLSVCMSACLCVCR